MARKGTKIQGLNWLLNSNNFQGVNYKSTTSHNYNVNNDILFKTKNKDEFITKSLENKQQAYLTKAWKRASYNQALTETQNTTGIQLMYREADLMDGFPEIGTAMDMIMEECCYQGESGFMVNVFSKSDRIKSIIQDLLVNRLSITTMLPMVCRSMIKYGNCFMLLNIDVNNGVIGWRELPVYEMQRFENGMNNPYANMYQNINSNGLDNNDSTKFIQVGANTELHPYRNFQMAHFRLLYNSIYLPYGVSFLNKARRHFRMLSMAEDMMLMYRLERSVERRVYKINVGAIDEKDVQAYVESVADEFKRQPVFDPITGQLDLRKATISTFDDYFVPVRDPNEPNPIETIKGGENLTAMDDIKFLQNKVLTALRIPKSFLNFEDAQGDGKNLSLLDVRFTRTVNRIQQMLIKELNKICIIHLYLLGFTDDLTNFTLTMNSPSSQSEMLQLENLAKKLDIIRNAITDNGNGIPIMSLTHALKTVMGMSESEIKKMWEEIRFEKSIANELELTPQIIKRTGLFDTVDNLYGEPGAQYQQNQQNGNGMDGGMGGGAMGGGGIGGLDFGGGDMGNMTGTDGELDLGDNGDMGGNLNGNMDNSQINNSMNTTDLENANSSESQNNSNESIIHNKKTLNESLLSIDEKKALEKNIPIIDKGFMINEEINTLSADLGTYITSSKNKKD